MRTVNVYYLYHALGPLNAMTDAEYEAALADWDPVAPDRYQAFLARHLKPSFDRWNAESQGRVLDALQYALVTGRVDLATVLADQWYSPMPSPDDPREVFEALWQLLEPGRSSRPDDVATWQERNIREEAVIRKRRK